MHFSEFIQTHLNTNMEKLHTSTNIENSTSTNSIEHDMLYVEEQSSLNLISVDDGVIEPLPDVDWSSSDLSFYNLTTTEDGTLVKPLSTVNQPNQKPICKTVEPTGELCITFTDEELHRLGIKKGDKFSFKEDKDGFILQKFQTVEIDLNELSRETLEMMIKMSCEEDISINEVVSNILEKFIEENKNNECA